MAASALRSARAALLHSVLDDYASKISLDGAAQVFIQDAFLAKSLADWVQSTHRDAPYSITVPASGAEDHGSESLLKSAGAKAAVSIPDDAYSHAIAEVGGIGRRAPMRQEILQALKTVYYALIPKGYAIVLFAKPGPLERILEAVVASGGKADFDKSKEVGFVVDEGPLIDLAEEAQFERGKIRWSERSVVLKGTELERVIRELEIHLQNPLGNCEENQGWKKRLHSEVDAEVQQNGGVSVEIWLMMAMKWDLLCA